MTDMPNVDAARPERTLHTPCDETCPTLSVGARDGLPRRAPLVGEGSRQIHAALAAAVAAA